jgi:hypothetical protein
VRSVAEGGTFLRAEIATEIAFIRASAKAAKISDLKPRENEVLRLLAAGWSMAEIAAETNLSYRTVATAAPDSNKDSGAQHGRPSAHCAQVETLMTTGLNVNPIEWRVPRRTCPPQNGEERYVAVRVSTAPFGTRTKLVGPLVSLVSCQANSLILIG